ncbi:MAG: terminase large subunit [Gammaproteobacteria bacterium]|nr:MAG: terminase large subunit [Gammaproteobacteria bacterium]
MTYADRAKRYAEAVVSGEIPACRLVRLACQRHLDELDKQDDDAFPFEFDPSAADEWCAFIELMPHIKGRWARERRKITLEDWQCFLVSVPFGWKRKADGLRRFRRVYVEVPRKNAKSTLTAALGLKAFAADDEFGAEVYSGAGSEKQAWEVFGPARLMAKNTTAFRDHYGVHVGAKALSILGRASKFEPIIGKPGDGASPSFSITDEYHEHATAEQYDTMVTGMGSRDQPMAWVITTAGSSIEGPCYSLRSELVDVLDGKVSDDEIFGMVYTIDEDDDWTNPESLRKANPNMGVSVREDYLLSQQRIAINHPRKAAVFKTKHLNVWVTAAAPYFNLESWNRGRSDGTPAEWLGHPVWVGVDLASKRDLCSVVSVAKREVDGEDHYWAWATHYLPEDRLEAPERAHYRGWQAEGWLTATPGVITDYDAIEEDVLALGEGHRIVGLGFDPYNATQLATHWLNEGIPCVEVPQNVRNLSEPMKWLEALIEAGRFHHYGDPVLTWALGNVTAQEDRNGNVYPRKEREERKIDPAVALIIAMSRAIGESEQAGSVYDDRGVTVL